MKTNQPTNRTNRLLAVYASFGRSGAYMAHYHKMTVCPARVAVSLATWQDANKCAKIDNRYS